MTIETRKSILFLAPLVPLMIGGCAQSGEAVTADPILDVEIVEQLPETTEELSSQQGDSEIMQPISDFNKEILKAIAYLAESKNGLGYDLRASFTEDLTYGDAVIPATGGTRTMCVAAVSEIMIRAVDSWSIEQEDLNPSAFDLVPARRWVRGALVDLRPWIYVYNLERTVPTYNRTYGSGTHDALILGGLGRSVSFDEAKAGDFANFSRTSGSGHAVVFIGYLKADYKEAVEFSDEVLGFKYFSAQGGRDTGGFGYRYAYFDGYCPERQTGKPRDCKLIKSDDVGLFSMGRLYSPEHWRTEDTTYFVNLLMSEGKSFEEIEAIRYEDVLRPMPRADEIEVLIEETEPVFALDFSGETTD